eukprot:2402410-Pleurochrysis_carterae.AAC.1
MLSRAIRCSPRTRHPCCTVARAADMAYTSTASQVVSNQPTTFSNLLAFSPTSPQLQAAVKPMTAAAAAHSCRQKVREVRIAGGAHAVAVTECSPCAEGEPRRYHSAPSPCQ